MSRGARFFLRLILGLSLPILVGVGVLALATPAAAQEGPVIPNERCLLCHSDPNLTMVLPSNEVLPVSVNERVLLGSVHASLNCQDCHNDKTGYPHSPFPAPNHRGWQIEISQVCGNCHGEQAGMRMDGIHGQLLAAGRLEAATCIDCHGAHDVHWTDPFEHPEVPADREIELCGACHSVIAADFMVSVHAEDLAARNPDVPTCSACHPAHAVQDPHTAQFRLKSPDLCGVCHADRELMAKYGISTYVFDTYVADFHGTTVKIFDDIAPGQVTNTAVCHDCHSAHRIMRVTAEESTVMQANLLATCQRCHPDATESFTASWMGHFPPDWQHYPIVTAVDWFYKLLIPGVLGFFVLYIGLDLGRGFMDWRRSRRPKSPPKTPPPPPAPESAAKPEAPEATAPVQPDTAPESDVAAATPAEPEPPPQPQPGEREGGAA